MKADLDASRSQHKTKEAELKKKDGDYAALKEQMKPITVSEICDMRLCRAQGGRRQIDRERTHSMVREYML